MNIDEFLDSNKTIEKIGKTDIIKIKYNENIDFIYEPEYRNFEYEAKLDFLGLFEKITKKLYGASFEFHSEYNKELYSNYYAGSIGELKEKLIGGANLYLKTYIDENELQLINNSKRIFDKFIADESNDNTIKKDAIKEYIYENDSKSLRFSIEDYYYDKHSKDLIIQYIQSPVEISKKIFNEYIDNQEKNKSIYINNNYEKITAKEWIGIMIQKNQYKNMLIQELRDNPNNEYKKKHDIINSIKDLDAQMITITLKHDKETVTFKYPKRLLATMDFYEWHIPDLKIRDELKNLYSNIYGQNKDDIFIKEIAKIEYKKKTIYEDKELIKFENSVFIKEDTHDIVDEMFD